MSSIEVMSSASLPNKEFYQVVYNSYQDEVVIEIGRTSLKLNAINFMMLNEMMRKAAARLAMKTEIKAY
jgi:hypothetical protein